MKEVTITKLRKYGFKKIDLESAVNYLPEDVWITRGPKNIKRESAQFLIKKEKNSYTISLSIYDREEEEVYVLQRITAPKLVQAVSEMLVFLGDNGLLSPDV